ncbi:hypothetical protein CW360_11600 [Pseudomonas fluvialis]|uniref:Uncharacterized protein n=1 Tax=Pseudomonas fluvialis TaxID=1793966 RepID=A0A2I0CNR9_9PSED|nr:hypothetical protein CW360_11600 [Pseudomonas pharmacofabricae]
MTRQTPKLTAQMAKSISGKPSSNGGQNNSRPAPSNAFPGGNWPSKVPGHKSGGNRGQGPKT